MAVEGLSSSAVGADDKDGLGGPAGLDGIDGLAVSDSDKGSGVTGSRGATPSSG